MYKMSRFFALFLRAAKFVSDPHHSHTTAVLSIREREESRPQMDNNMADMTYIVEVVVVVAYSVGIRSNMDTTKYSNINPLTQLHLHAI